MAGRSTSRGPSSRRISPRFEELDARELMSAGGLTHSLGPYVTSSRPGPRIQQPAVRVNAHLATADLLHSLLGAGVDRVQAAHDAMGNNPRGGLKETVLGQPFVNGVLSNRDTYEILRAPAFNALIGTQQVSGSMGVDATGTGVDALAPPVAAPIPTTPTTETTPIAFRFPEEAQILSLGPLTTTVQVNPNGGIPGFIVEVPTTSIRILDQGPPASGSVTLDRSQIPAGYPLPDASFQPIGTFAPLYAETAPLLNEMINAGAGGAAPNAPYSVPGLRLVPAVGRSRTFPNPAAQRDFTRALRLAVQRNVFQLNDGQSQAVFAGINEFAREVDAMQRAGSFTPDVPPVPPALPARPLANTLQVSVGAVRQLVSVDPGLAGLQVPGLGNFPGRFDVGYVFDRAGNYGIILSARGPLSNANPDRTPVDVAAGDIRIEVSNAPSLSALDGTRLVEGVSVGSFVSTDLQASENENGVFAYSASAGYGLGLDYGTGVGYTRVIPLGNVNALIPSAPRR